MHGYGGPGAAGDEGRLLVFRVGGRRFGVGIPWVRGVSAHDAPDGERAAGPGAGTVIDARALGWAEDGIPPFGAPVAEVVLGFECGGESVTLLVDAVEGIEEAGVLAPWPRLIASSVDRAFRGVAVRPGGALVVIDAAALLPERRGECRRVMEA